MSLRRYRIKRGCFDNISWACMLEYAEVIVNCFIHRWYVLPAKILQQCKWWRETNAVHSGLMYLLSSLAGEAACYYGVVPYLTQSKSAYRHLHVLCIHIYIWFKRRCESHEFHWLHTTHSAQTTYLEARATSNLEYKNTNCILPSEDAINWLNLVAVFPPACIQSGPFC